MKHLITSTIYDVFRSETSRTQQQSLEWIILLSTQYLRIRQHMKHPQIISILRRVPDLFMTRLYPDESQSSLLKFLTAQAVICISDSELTETSDEVTLSFAADISLVLAAATDGAGAHGVTKSIDLASLFRLFAYCR